MNVRDREPSPELDLSRMVTRPHAPSLAIWWLLATVLLLGAVTAPAILFWRSEPAGSAEYVSAAAGQPEEVTRATTGLLDALPVPPGDPVSHQLRQPIRLTDRSAKNHDLGHLTARALARFNHTTVPGDALHRVLVQTLAEGQSDAYIDAALNAALSRGEFAAPIALTTPFGEIDTPRLLAVVLAEAKG
ncbi:hypothetical protein KX928_02375 [Roseobacter sp. YSTF-M11]|uniref:Uncharacterized protein n=1 Tax=Roseobacter insulae TaxID=2859783 RepID=A0A9X1FS32_9RHOB|nr:hypothetical protein [Roseobacter insulae]MBW4706623.1 hypothetical protein [Roseobacter insulae]